MFGRKRDACAKQYHDEEDHDDMTHVHSLDIWSEREQAEHSRACDNRIVAGALPIASSQMQPHPKFIKGERQADAIHRRSNASGPSNSRGR
jgi:hypothetical protein